MDARARAALAVFAVGNLVAGLAALRGRAGCDFVLGERGACWLAAGMLPLTVPLLVAIPSAAALVLLHRAARRSGAPRLAAAALAAALLVPIAAVAGWAGGASVCEASAAGPTTCSEEWGRDALALPAGAALVAAATFAAALRTLGGPARAPPLGA